MFDADTSGNFRTYDIVGERWKESKYLQFLASAEVILLSNTVDELQDDATSDISERADASGRTDTSDPDGLSTIPARVNVQIGAMLSNGSNLRSNSKCSYADPIEIPK